MAIAGWVTGEIEFRSLLVDSHAHASTLSFQFHLQEENDCHCAREELSRNDTSRSRAAGTESDDKMVKEICISIEYALQKASTPSGMN